MSSSSTNVSMPWACEKQGSDTLSVQINFKGTTWHAGYFK
jgi:hypothetical protein